MWPFHVKFLSMKIPKNFAWLTIFIFVAFLFLETYLYYEDTYNTMSVNPTRSCSYGSVQGYF